MSRRDPNVESALASGSAVSGSAVFWKSIEEKNSSDGLKNAKTAEFPLDRPLQMTKEEAPESLAALITGDKGLGANVSRRGLMKFGTAVTALFGLDGCIRRPVEKLVPYSHAPEQVIPGISNHYATAIYRRGDALGVLVESHEGRPTKVEGNPDHPSSRGSTDALAQAAIYDLYDPDRSTTPMHGAAKATHEEFDAFFEKKLKEHDADRGAKLRVLAQPTNSPSFVRLRDAVRARFPHSRFHTYASVGESNMREGARLAFGQPVNALYDYAHARVIVSLDSDFLQTEPGMVRATRLFADGRRIRSGEESMNRLYVIESTYSTTGANADHRLRLPSRDIERYARLLAKELHTNFRINVGPIVGPALGTHPTDGIPEHWLKVVAKELADNQGRAILVAGSRQPPSVHALVHAMNAALG
ncbi:MAG: TAT-variant-translocated molybdopterin oxidoreductase, partial [Polyangiaceae bacterium]